MSIGISAVIQSTFIAHPAVVAKGAIHIIAVSGHFTFQGSALVAEDKQFGRRKRFAVLVAAGVTHGAVVLKMIAVAVVMAELPDTIHVTLLSCWIETGHVRI